MMNTKNLFKFRESASITFFDEISPKHILSDSNEGRFPHTFAGFSCTFYRTIFSFSYTRRRIFEFFVTMKTFKVSGASFNLRFIITFSRTIFCFIASGRNMSELLRTNKTISNYLNSAKLIFAFPRAIFGSFKPINSNIKFALTGDTFYKLSSMRFCHAIIQR